jgi:perosamine synthetase
MTGKQIKTPWFIPKMTGNEMDYLEKVIVSGFVNDGPVTQQFEQSIAKIAGTKFAVAVTSGTVAISLSLLASGVKPGDEVLLPNLTFIATANAITMIGAQPIFVDIEPERLCMSFEAAKIKITKKTTAIVTVDVNGRGAAYDLFEPFCKENNLILVSDSAEALGSVYKGRPTGSFGQAGCFSFSPAKIITTGQGGVVTTNDEDIYSRLLSLKDQGRPARGSGGDDLHPFLGFNFKFTDIQASVGMAQLQEFKKRVAFFKEREKLYNEAFAGHECLVGGSAEELRLWTDVKVKKPKVLQVMLKEHGFDSRAFWFPITSQPPYLQPYGRYPNTEIVSEQGLWLPSGFDLTVEEIQEVADLIKKFL